MINLSSRQFKTLYRGVNAGEHWKNDLGEGPVKEVPNPIKEEGSAMYGEGIGVHWTDRRSKTERFAHPTYDPYKVGLSDKRPTAAIIHAKVNKNDIFKNDEEHYDPRESDFVEPRFDPTGKEREHAVFPGSTVHVTKVEKIRQSGKKREIRYNPPRERKA